MYSENTKDLNEDGEDSIKWCGKNKMSVNISKTKAMFITSAQKQAIIQESPPKIKTDSTVIKLSRQEKLLGVIIDCTLNWAAHVETTIKKCNSLLYLLGRIKTYLDIPTRKL